MATHNDCYPQGQVSFLKTASCPLRNVAEQQNWCYELSILVIWKEKATLKNDFFNWIPPPPPLDGDWQVKVRMRSKPNYSSNNNQNRVRSNFFEYVMTTNGYCVVKKQKKNLRDFIAVTNPGQPLMSRVQQREVWMKRQSCFMTVSSQRWDWTLKEL